MEQRSLGPLTVSLVGLGCNNFGQRLDATHTGDVVGAALDAGVTFFDTADVYGATRSEEYLGRALGPRRDEAVIATKFGMEHADAGLRGGADAGYVREAVEQSLERLGTDRIDLYQLHTPDDATPIAETLGALGDLVDQGKVRAIGCSNFSARQIDEARAAADQMGSAAFVSVQNRYSVLTRTPESEGVVDACRRHGLGILPFFPLESGLLTGKYRAGEAAPDGTRLASMGDRAERFRNADADAVVERLRAFCEHRGRTLLELAFSWLASQDTVSSIIAGATRPDQVVANVGAADWRLDNAELAEVDRIVAV
jgi:aryl-alcohol dehydrogenase-like predicted oxidoreductase